MMSMETYMDAFGQALRTLEGTFARPGCGDGGEHDEIEAFHSAFKASWQCLVHFLHFSVLDELGDAHSTIYAAYIDALIADEEGWRAMLADSDVPLRPLSAERSHILTSRLRERHYPLLTELERVLRDRLNA